MIFFMFFCFRQQNLCITFESRPQQLCVSNPSLQYLIQTIPLKSLRVFRCWGSPPFNPLNIPPVALAISRRKNQITAAFTNSSAAEKHPQQRQNTHLSRGCRQTLNTRSHQRPDPHVCLCSDCSTHSLPSSFHPRQLEWLTFSVSSSSFSIRPDVTSAL